MKKIVVLLFTFFAITTIVNAQQNNRYVEVYGKTTYQKNIQQYNVDIIVSLDYANNGMYSSIEEIKEGYFKKIEKIGINPSQLKEDLYKYAILGYQGQGTIYHFETPSKELFVKFLNLKQTGVQVYTKTMNYSINEEVAEISKKAIENARQKAINIAGKMHKKIGRIFEIKDLNDLQSKNKNEEISYYSYTNENTYSVTVKFELKDE